MSDSFQELTAHIENGERTITLSGLTSISAKAFAAARLAANTDIRLAIVTDTNQDAEKWASDLSFFLSRHAPSKTVMVLPSFETSPYSSTSPHAETEERRALGLWHLAQGRVDIVVLPARSLAQRTVTRNEISSIGFQLKRDGDLPIEELVDRLTSAGFVREDPVEGPGQFSLRGGIADIWPPNIDSPIRIEFFGDTIDSLRTFDPITQLSTGHIDEVSIAPMREYSASPDDLRDWAFFAKERFDEPAFARNLTDRTEFAELGETFSGWESLLPLTKDLSGDVFEYLSGRALMIDEPSTIEMHIASLFERLNDEYAKTIESGDIALQPDELFLSGNELRSRLEHLRHIELRALGSLAAAGDHEIATDGKVAAAESRLKTATPLFLFPVADSKYEKNISTRQTRKFSGDIKSFAEEIKRQSNFEIVTQTQGMAERIDEMLRDYDLTPPTGSIIVGHISSGFEMPGDGIVIYSESDIFGESQSEVLSSRRIATGGRKSKLGAFISDFRDLKNGDFVVHVDHGIGRFEGLQVIASQGSEREFMLLIYADNSKLFVPVERMDLVSRYSSGESTAPTLDRLGGLGWQKTKARAKRAMRDMADELLKLYAERRLVRGHAFPPDAPWQQEFEDSFPYDLTTDQATAITDVKNDMESQMPMDRLIIGDVGYGKTEVAMRAAFKAVMDGKQVAVLTPTTVLAYQHFETFSKRFSAFPVKVDLLSRFRTSKEQKAVTERAEKGDVDLVVGTHRILSTDVKLPNLGLVVIDEEQRFGVGHKEKLKQLKKKVDVLTLSATPIPRTLNMSLLGMRDMSVIETPPRDRLAINTQVVQFSENVIRSAIELELSRNGQIFFIHNRVESIESIAALIQKIVPSARIAIGHGQMNEKEMEQVMLDFIDYKYDVLVATTIIENGIDIPRANTIIINRADNYGLSQLYQLRGRVGRSNRRAYAYLLIPSELELTPIARRRLSAIREFSDLGAGFRLAALDLELRGAGNILGGQQSGHLDALGFDLYTRMLERTIAEIKGDEIADDISVSINLGVDVSIPREFIADAGQRLRTYKRIASAANEEDFATIYSEIEDRYGRIPYTVTQLFDYGRLRRRAESLGIISIDKVSGSAAIKLSENSRINVAKLLEFVDKNEGAAFSSNGILRSALPAGADVFESIQLVLDAITD